MKGVLAAAAGGPGVINLSLGGDSAEVPIRQAIATAVSKGMLVVAASGNDGDAGNRLTYPASLPHVLTVGATDSRNGVAVFSSRSSFVDLAAPGQDIVVADALSQGWESEDGTSFASPIVAGAAAWVWTVRPELDASQLFEVMRRSATDIAPPGRDDASGFGLLSVPAALAYTAPIKDSPEPNDDIDYVKPGGTYYNGIPVLTSRAKPSASRGGTDHRLRGPARRVPRVRPEERASHRRNERRFHDRPHAVGPHDRDGHRGEPRQGQARPRQDAGLDRDADVRQRRCCDDGLPGCLAREAHP